MKILKLRFKNINSLAGEHEIDFTNPIFTNTGIFAITGKTGTGKTSLLDAMTLALYGKTPRVSISQSENPVMTRGEFDCFSELTIETGGNIYTASWQQKLSKTGILQPVNRRIIDDKGEIIAEKIKECDKKIEEILGLNFEQFTKVIMLAQGNFAAFLQADKNEKGKLLEQITGTEIYGIISEKVFERTKQEKEKLEKITIELEAIKTFTDEEIRGLNQRLSELDNKKNEVSIAIQNAEQAHKWLTDLYALQHQLNENREALEQLEPNAISAKARLKEISSDLEKAIGELRNNEPIFKEVREIDARVAEKEKSIQPLNISIAELTNDIAIDKRKIQDLQKELNTAQIQWEEKRKWAEENKIYEELLSQYTAIEQEYFSLQKRYEQISNLNQEIIVLQKQLDAENQKHEAALNDLNTKETLLKAKEDNLKDILMQLQKLLNGKQITEYQKEKDKAMELRSHFIRLIELEESNSAVITDIQNYSDTLQQLDTQIQEISSALENRLEILQLTNETIKQLNDYIQLARTVQSLDEHRIQLKDGEPCPLCGSTEHPFAQGNVPRIADKEKELIKVKKQFDELNFEIQTLIEKKASLSTQKENTQKNRKKAEEILENNQKKKKEIFVTINDFHVDGITYEKNQDIPTLRLILHQQEIETEKLKQLIETAHQFNESITRLREKEIPALQSEKTKAEALRNEIEKAINVANQTLSVKKEFRDDLLNQFASQQNILNEKLNRYGAANITHLKSSLDVWKENSQVLEILSQRIENLQHEIQLKTQKLGTNIKTLSEKQNERGKLEQIKRELQAKRIELMGEKSVDDEENRLKTEISRLENLKEETQARTIEIQTQLEKLNAVISEKEKEYQQLRQNKIPDNSLENLETELKQLKSKSEAILQEMGAIKTKLLINDENLRMLSQKANEKLKQEQIFNQWSALNELIGSKDGKKYRNFAQSLTFEYLIDRANIQLHKISDRYVLKRADNIEDPFELEVIDKYQNGETRTIQNLSGGEKFIVSLSFALGLANMASKNIRIDSMFIDEGFGTLDSDYLDIALTALSNLQSEGKIIGVISHLAELKERIPTHIEIISTGQGRSTIKIAG